MTSTVSHRAALRLAALSSVLSAAAILLALVVSGALAARMLGPTDRGYYALLSLAPSVVCQLSGLGISLGLAHFVANGSISARRAVGLLQRPITVQIVVALCAATAFGLALQCGHPNYVKVAALVAATTAVSTFLKEHGLALIQASGASAAANAFKALPQVLTALVFVGLYVSGETALPTVIVGWALADWFAGVTTASWAARCVRRDVRTERKTKVERSEILSYGRAGYLSYLSPLDTFRLDQLYVGLAMSPASLGYYAAGAAFTNIPRTLAHNLGLTAAPFVSRHLALKEGRDHRPTLAFALLGVGISAVTAFGIAILAPVIVPALFGEPFRPAISVTQIVMIGAFFFASRRIAVDLLRGVGDARAGLVPELVGLATFAVALPLLSSSDGLEGVAWAFSLAGATNFVALGISQRRRLGQAFEMIGSRRERPD